MCLYLSIYQKITFLKLKVLGRMYGYLLYSVNRWPVNGANPGVYLI